MVRWSNRLVRCSHGSVIATTKITRSHHDQPLQKRVGERHQPLVQGLQSSTGQVGGFQPMIGEKTLPRLLATSIGTMGLPSAIGLLPFPQIKQLVQGSPG